MELDQGKPLTVASIVQQFREGGVNEDHIAKLIDLFETQTVSAGAMYDMMFAQNALNLSLVEALQNVTEGKGINMQAVISDLRASILAAQTIIVEVSKKTFDRPKNG